MRARRSRDGFGKGNGRRGATVAPRLDSLGVDVEDDEAELMLLVPVAGDDHSSVNRRSPAKARVRVSVKNGETDRGFDGEREGAAGHMGRLFSLQGALQAKAWAQGSAWEAPMPSTAATGGR